MTPLTRPFVIFFSL